jgi:hypothetical protein
METSSTLYRSTGWEITFLWILDLYSRISTGKGTLMLLISLLVSVQRWTIVKRAV